MAQKRIGIEQGNFAGEDNEDKQQAENAQHHMSGLNWGLANLPAWGGSGHEGFRSAQRAAP